MNTDELKNIINQYFDNELTKNEEIILFTELSRDDNARDYFKEMNLLKTLVEESVVEYPEGLDAKVFSKLTNEEKIIQPKINRARIFTAISYGFAIILLALSFFFYNETLQYRNKLDVTYNQLKQQNQMIQVLFNSLPQTEVKAEFANEIIVTPKM